MCAYCTLHKTGISLPYLLNLPAVVRTPFQTIARVPDHPRTRQYNPITDRVYQTDEVCRYYTSGCIHSTGSQRCFPPSVSAAVVGRSSSVGKHGHVAGGRTSSSDGTRRRWFALVRTSPCTLSEWTHGSCMRCPTLFECRAENRHAASPLPKQNLPYVTFTGFHVRTTTHIFGSFRSVWPHYNMHSHNCRAMSFICTCGRMVHGTCCAA